MQLRISLATCVLVWLASAALADDVSERQAWRAEIAAQRARADQQRAVLKAEFERNKLMRPRSNPDEEAARRARAASEQAVNDMSLVPGDIVSTTQGLLLFHGDGQGPRTITNFSPVGPGQPQRTPAQP